MVVLCSVGTFRAPLPLLTYHCQYTDTRPLSLSLSVGAPTLARRYRTRSISYISIYIGCTVYYTVMSHSTAREAKGESHPEWWTYPTRCCFYPTYRYIAIHWPLPRGYKMRYDIWDIDIAYSIRTYGTLYTRWKMLGYNPLLVEGLFAFVRRKRGLFLQSSPLDGVCMVTLSRRREGGE